MARGLAIHTKMRLAVSIHLCSPIPNSDGTSPNNCGSHAKLITFVLHIDVICTSIVDVRVLKTSEFVFLISEYAGT